MDFVKKPVVLAVEIHIVIKLMDTVNVKMDIMGIDVTKNALLIVNHVIK